MPYSQSGSNRKRREEKRREEKRREEKRREEKRREEKRRGSKHLDRTGNGLFEGTFSSVFRKDRIKQKENTIR
jgi:hypothetical protein